MIRQTISITCDAKGCSSQFQSPEVNSTELARLATDAGWDVVHPLDVEPEAHFCPDHKRTDGGSKLIRNVSEDELR